MFLRLWRNEHVGYKLNYFVLQRMILCPSADDVLRYKLNYFVPGGMKKTGDHIFYVKHPYDTDVSVAVPPPSSNKFASCGRTTADSLDRPNFT